MEYLLLESGLIQRVDDGAYIPQDPDNADYQAYLAWCEAGNVAQPEPPPEDTVPQSVTAAQGGIALIRAGLMNAVQAVVDAADTPAEVKWAWQRAQDWQRDSAALAYLAQRANITAQQMDDLFVAAAQIQA